MKQHKRLVKLFASMLATMFFAVSVPLAASANEPEQQPADNIEAGAIVPEETPPEVAPVPVDPPVVDPPVVAPPVVDPPVVDPPVAESPAAQLPTSELPVAEIPAENPPASEPPVSLPLPSVSSSLPAGSSAAPALSAPVSSAPVSSAPESALDEELLALDALVEPFASDTFSMDVTTEAATNAPGTHVTLVFTIHSNIDFAAKPMSIGITGVTDAPTPSSNLSLFDSPLTAGQPGNALWQAAHDGYEIRIDTTADWMENPSENVYVFRKSLRLRDTLQPGDTVAYGLFTFTEGEDTPFSLGSFNEVVRPHPSGSSAAHPAFTFGVPVQTQGTVFKGQLNDETNKAVHVTLPSGFRDEFATISVGSTESQNLLSYFYGGNMLPGATPSGKIVIDNQTGFEYKINSIQFDTSVIAARPSQVYTDTVINTLQTHPDYAEFYKFLTDYGYDRYQWIPMAETHMAIKDGSGQVVLSGLDRLLYDTFSGGGAFTTDSARKMAANMFVTYQNGFYYGPTNREDLVDTSFYRQASGIGASYYMFAKFGDNGESPSNAKYRLYDTLMSGTNNSLVDNIGTQGSLLPGEQSVSCNFAISGRLKNAFNQSVPLYDVGFYIVIERVDKNPPPTSSTSSIPTSSTSSIPTSSTSSIPTSSTSSIPTSSTSSIPTSSTSSIPTSSTSSIPTSSTSSIPTSSTSSIPTSSTPTTPPVASSDAGGGTTPPTPPTPGPGPTPPPVTPVAPPTPFAPPAAIIPPAVAPVAPVPSAPTATIPGDGTPAAPPETEDIVDDTTPLFGDSGQNWALLNLILSIISGAASIFLVLVLLLEKNKAKKAAFTSENEDIDAITVEEFDTTKAKKNAFMWRVAAVATGVISPIAFLITENMKLRMAFVDKWTLLMLLISAVQLGFIFMLRKTQNHNADIAHDDRDDASPA